MSVEKSGLGILVLGFNRPDHLKAVLESLQKQSVLGAVHVWVDGTQGRAEYQGANEQSVRVAQTFRVRDIRAIRGHLGIEKLMLDALDCMSALYDRVLVLEDDCFPTAHCVANFEAALDEVAFRPDVFSVYGHHFGVESNDDRDFTRFQGWGWAAHSEQIIKLLPELRSLFMMEEGAYLDHVANDMTSIIRGRLDVTPGRDVLKVLEQFYSWDSATSFLCAQRGLYHRRT